MRGAVIAGFLALLGSPAVAQEASDDWDLTVDESQQLTLASTGYSSGQAIAVRCMDNSLELLIAGLPPMEGSVRRIEAEYDDGRVEAGLWFTRGDGSLVFSPTPQMDARRLRQGGPLQLSVAVDPGPEHPTRRYALDLPTESAHLDQVLRACGADRPDPRDDLVRWNHPLGVSNLWRRQPTPRYPDAAVRLGAGFAVFSCIADGDGGLGDCRIERESHAVRYGFGDEALKSLRDARVAPADEGGPQPGVLFVGTLRFRIGS